MSSSLDLSQFNNVPIGVVVSNGSGDVVREGDVLAVNMQQGYVTSAGMITNVDTNGVLRVAAEEAPAQYEHAIITCRGDSLDGDARREIQRQGLFGFCIVAAYVTQRGGELQPVHTIIMARRKGAGDTLEKLRKEQEQIDRGWAALQKVKENSDIRLQGIERREAELGAKELKLEKIRQGLVDEGELKCHPRRKVLLDELKMKDPAEQKKIEEAELLEELSKAPEPPTGDEDFNED